MPEYRRLAATAATSLLRVPSHVLGRTVLDLELSGASHLPRQGPVVVAANHFSHLDVPLVATHLDRPIRFLAVDELYGKSRFMDATLGFFRAIPLDRDGYPVAAMRTAIDHLASGRMIGVFPEGRRVEMWGVNPPKRGAAWLAWMAGAPLVPVAIHGTQATLAPAARGLSRTAVKMWVEPPLWWSDYVDHVDPLGSMMSDWYTAVNDHLEPWKQVLAGDVAKDDEA